MAGGFKMQFVADVAPFLRGTKDVEGALDKVAGSLDDLAKDATKAGGKAADAIADVGDSADRTARDVDDAADAASDSLKSIGDGAKSAAREVDTQTEKAADSVEDVGDSAKKTRKVIDTETDKMGRSFKDVLDDVKTNGRTSFQAMGEDAKAGTREASEGFSEMKDEANQTAREAAASFSGDPIDALDALQETAANALAGFGPLGAAAGIALAVGLGLAQAKLQELADKANEFKENVGEIGKEIAAGEYDPKAAFEEWSTQLQDAKSWFELWQDEAVNNIEHVRDAAGKAGEDLGKMVAPLVRGDVDQAKANLQALRDKQDRLNETVRDGTEIYEGGVVVQSEAAKAAQTQADGVDDLIDVYEDQIKILEEAHEQAVLQKMATEDLTRAEADLALKIDDVNRARDERVDGSRSAVQAEWDMEDAVKATTDAIAAGVTKGREAEETLFEQAGKARDLAAAQETLSGDTGDYNKVIDEQRRKFIENATQMGYTASEAELLAQKYGLIPKVVSTDVNAETEAAKAAIDDVKRRLDDLPLAKYITIEAIDRYSQVASQVYSATGGQGRGTGVTSRATGGIVPGQPSTMDNQYIHAASGEFVVNATATAKHRELLEAINQGRTPRTTGGGTAPVINMTVNALPGMDAAAVAEIAAKKISEALDQQLRHQRGGRYTRGREW